MKWIAIKDQLLPKVEPLLLHGAFDYEFAVGEYSDGEFYTCDYEGRIYGVTHWAEITPPEIGESK